MCGRLLIRSWLEIRELGVSQRRTWILVLVCLLLAGRLVIFWFCLLNSEWFFVRQTSLYGVFFLGLKSLYIWFCDFTNWGETFFIFYNWLICLWFSRIKVCAVVYRRRNKANGAAKLVLKPCYLTQNKADQAKRFTNVSFRKYQH